MPNRTLVAFPASVAALVCALGGCSSRTDLSLTGNTPAQYSHVWLTIQAVWFNTSATAGPDDGGWSKFTLSTPATIDLVAENGGNLGSVVTGLKLTPGTYSQVRVVAVDPSAPLTTSASAAGAIYNAEVDYSDGSGTHQLPLELLNADKGLGIAASLRVPVGNVGAALAATGAASTSGTTSGGGTAFMAATGAFAGNGAGAAPGTGTTATTASASSPRSKFAVSIDGASDLIPFTYGASAGTGAGATSGIMLSQHATAYDLMRVGAIQGTLTLTGIAGSNGLPALEADAESVSTDGTRHVVVARTPVHSDGTFMLYPLAAGADAAHPIDYDVVIHGAGIATIIIRTVQVAITRSGATTSTATPQTGSASGGASASTSTSSVTLTPVSIGTLTPRSAGSFEASPVGGSAALPAGAAIAFYQTLGGTGEIPFVIESRPIDPFNQDLASPQALSSGTIDSGTWSSGGAAVTLVTAAPAEGAGQYLVGATAPAYTGGPLTTKVAAPTSGNGPVAVVVPGLTPASGATGSIAATVTQATPGKYDHGQLLVSHDGTLVATTSLDAALTTGNAAVGLAGLPAGTAAAVYYVAVRAWNSRDPQGTLQRQSYPTVIDLRSGVRGSITLTIN